MQSYARLIHNIILYFCTHQSHVNHRESRSVNPFYNNGDGWHVAIPSICILVWSFCASRQDQSETYVVFFEVFKFFYVLNKDKRNETQSRCLCPRYCRFSKYAQRYNQHFSTEARSMDVPPRYWSAAEYADTKNIIQVLWVRIKMELFSNFPVS